MQSPFLFLVGISKLCIGEEQPASDNQRGAARQKSDPQIVFSFFTHDQFAGRFSWIMKENQSVLLLIESGLNRGVGSFASC